MVRLSATSNPEFVYLLWDIAVPGIQCLRSETKPGRQGFLICSSACPTPNSTVTASKGVLP